MRFRARLDRWEMRGAIAVMAAMVLAFCLSGVVPAPAHAGGPACDSAGPSPTICAQPGTGQPAPAIGIQAVPHLGPAGAASAPLVVAPASAPIPRVHAGPSSPRAPPASLA